MKKKRKSGSFTTYFMCGISSFLKKLPLIFFVFNLIVVQAKGYTQTTVNMHIENATLPEIFKEITRQTGYHFLYNNDQISNTDKITLDMKDRNLNDILTECLKNTGLGYLIENNMIIISPKIQQRDETRRVDIKGEVTNERKEPLPGVTVLIKGTTYGTSTDVNGVFSLSIPAMDSIKLVFSFIGMKTLEMAYSGQTQINAIMKEDVSEIEQVNVISTGIFNKPRESFTGAVTAVNREELRIAGSRGLVSALSNIDPSFRISTDLESGSDPNKLPEVTIRGHSSLTTDLNELQNETGYNPNLPLFILDGFEITYSRFNELDINYVENVFIYKDASATAMYGARGANGVVVITSREPEPGRLQITYDGGVKVEIADLSSFNLMNSFEKLEFELLSGLYNSTSPEKEQDLQKVYNNRLMDAYAGVDTYWLKYPIRTAVGQSHNFRAEGGSKEFRYSANLSYGNNAGGMKGSERNSLYGTVDLRYNFKNLIVRNSLQIGYVVGKNSPYGNFGVYAQINSYFKPYDNDGNLIQRLDNNTYNVGFIQSSGSRYIHTAEVYNPLYNAYLGSFDENKTKSISNNFSLEWNIIKELRVRAAFGISTNNNKSDNFKSPEHTDFINYTGDNLKRRGTYTQAFAESNTWNLSFTANYNKLIQDLHQITVGLNYEMREDKKDNSSFTGEGFPTSIGGKPHISNAAQYYQNGSPGGSESILRTLGATLSLNYTYDRRYFADFNIRLDASSFNGTNNRTTPFWSVGIGWNIHQESFLFNSFVNNARLRANYGISGNLNFNPYQAIRTYSIYNNVFYNSWTGASMMALGNPDLGWQKTHSYNLGTDLGFFENRVFLTFNIYKKFTEDLLADMTLPLSSGFGTYRANIGEIENKGFDFTLSTYVIRNRESDITWLVGVNFYSNKNKIKKISSALETLNDELLETDGNNPSFLYKEGESINSIYAVKSLGIDPGNGEEIFIKKNGDLTYDWDAKDKVACGTTDSKLSGRINTNFKYKSFSIDMIFGFHTGGYQYNDKLLEKTENAYPYKNADKRALYDRWTTPGESAKYKKITSYRSTKATSRFVMKYDVLSLNTVGISYYNNSAWLKRNLRIDYLMARVSSDDLFIWSATKIERGTSYPFTRTINFSLTARF